MVFEENNSGSVVLNIQNLTKIVGGTHQVALSDVTLQVRLGRVLGLVGDNQISRATLFRLILGLQSPDSGSLKIFDQDYSVGMSNVTSRIGFVPENIELTKNINSIEYLKLVSQLSGVRKQEAVAQIAKFSEILHFGDHLGTSIRKLKRSEARCLVLIGALVHNPEILLLEEPAKDFNLGMRKVVRHLIRDLSGEGKTIIISSDDLPFLEQVTSDLAIFADGRLAFQGSLLSIKGVEDIPTVSVSFTGSVDRFESELRVHVNRGILSYRFVVDTCDIYFDPEMFLSERLRLLLDIIENSEITLLDLRPSAVDLEDAIDGVVNKFRGTRASKLLGARQPEPHKSLGYSQIDDN